MITIQNKQLCTGCTACAAVCPIQCILMRIDDEGFGYPVVDLSKCIDCGLCEKICPALHPKKPITPLGAFAAINRDSEIVDRSSSGGVFSALAEEIICSGGVAYGACFNDRWEVVHSSTETIDGLSLFRGSKYVQSELGNTFSDVKEKLKSGRKVLFSGTPCQVSGLNSFLGRTYDNLLTVDFICHGVPSPKVWNRYRRDLAVKLLENTVSQSGETEFFSSINFRDKTDGWKKYSFTASVRCADKNTVSLRNQHTQNTFMRGFLSHLYLRPSCHQCPSKSLSSGSDITIADFWNVEDVLPELQNNDRGVSLFMVNSNKVEIEKMRDKLHIRSVSFESGTCENAALFISVKPHRKRQEFFDRLDTCKSIEELIEELIRVPVILVFLRKLKSLIRMIAVRKIIQR